MYQSIAAEKETGTDDTFTIDADLAMVNHISNQLQEVANLAEDHKIRAAHATILEDAENAQQAVTAAKTLAQATLQELNAYIERYQLSITL